MDEHIKENTMPNTTTLTVEGMTCGHCEMAVAKAVRTLPNVKEASASRDNRTVTIIHDGELEIQAVKNVIEEAGYSVTV
jgi:copper chaperone